ncbi:tat (twin-arginine translocation) pathway signal sequence [Streptomyces sp. NPDC088337]|uniref:tat (twin-arginine translocation) pathway signal sequence n=1 Tax=unclassified Streptomyces TaxID=2593676 RepID=UPI002DD93083|nr:tat (twin-arginine translocation) pathway signal sequence [Streptomyces sp. NBC_01788]WSB26454.1 tat (twin-arginine translocation) pathway signal sequence [Streptomyces sp. NBC_01788]
MSRFEIRSRLTATPRRQIGLLTALAGAVLVAFFLAPNALARSSVNTANVGDTFRRGFVAYWGSGSEDFPTQLSTTVAFWFRFHLVKAGVSALLLAVAVVLGVVLSRHLRQSTGGRTSRFPLALYRALVGVLGLFALVALLANLQGAAAPFASLMPMLTSGGADGELTATLGQVQQQIAVYPEGRHSPALAVMISDFALYHAVLAAMAVIVALAMTGASVVCWRRLRTSSDTRSRRAMKFGGTGSAILAAVVLVIAYANTTTATHSPQALADFFAGGW